MHNLSPTPTPPHHHHHCQDDDANPLVGVSGRTSLLQRLGEAVSRVPEYFTASAVDPFARPGTWPL